MQTEITSFWEWQQHFSDEKKCLQALIKLGGLMASVVVAAATKKAGYCKPATSMNAPDATTTPR